MGKTQKETRDYYFKWWHRKNQIWQRRKKPGFCQPLRLDKVVCHHRSQRKITHYNTLLVMSENQLLLLHSFICDTCMYELQQQ